MGQVFSGDLISYSTQQNVWDELKERDPARSRSRSARRSCGWSSPPRSGYTAVKAGKFADRGLTILALVGISMPVFWIGALMNYYLGFKWGLFPNGGYVPFFDDPWQWFYHLLMPWTALSLLFIGVYSRILRSNVLDTINEDYVRTARAKGLSERACCFTTCCATR